jgi:endoribonuclease Dicer
LGLAVSSANFIAGAGKTLIAVLLLRYIFAQELEDRALGKPPRISFFIVDSVTLVFQQHAVLKANLDQPMNMFCGDMGVDLWNKKQWDKHFKENMVIVCTAEVLRHCLHRSFISMEQINIMIFDEAHHAKKDHPYARIIKDFYAQTRTECLRPKIFGMTASPVDARVDVRRAALELEGLLHSQICTIDDPELAKYTVSPTQELIARYPPLGPTSQTPLFSQIRELLVTHKTVARPLTFALEASRSLGTWCADQVWLYCLGNDDEFEKLSAKTERNFHKGRSHGSLAALEQLKSKLQQARDVVKTHKFEDPDFNVAEAKGQQYTSKNISSKVVVLVQYLKERFERPTDDRCIIFVKQRYTARLLETLLSHPKIRTSHLFVGSLVRLFLHCLRRFSHLIGWYEVGRSRRS